MQDVPGIIPAFVITLIWALRELIPVLARELRRRRTDSDRSEPPAVRDTMPTPQYHQSADGTGPHGALGPHGTYREAGLQTHPFVTRPELRELTDGMREMAARIDELSRTVGRLEGAIQHMAPLPPRPTRIPRPGGR